VNLKTRRLDEMIAWYGTVVGMTLVFKFAGGAWLTNDEANHRIALLTSSKLRDDPGKLAHSGMHHFSFEHKSYDDLFSTYLRLSQLGIEPHMCLDHGMTMSMYFVDPDGNSVELQVDNFGDWKQSSAFMLSAAFARDPIGTPFDPRKAAEAWKGGATPQELHQRTYEGEFTPGAPLDVRFPID
jgi:catechol-2,3-dioxygenase